MSEPFGRVLDASALLAYLYAEDGAETVQKALAEGCLLGRVNWAEVLSKVADAGDSPGDLVARLGETRLLGASLKIEAFHDADAVRVAELRPQTKHLGLSLGDRACLALGQRLGLPVMTADREWQKLDGIVAVEVELIR